MLERSYAQVRALDAQDPLSHMRGRFHLPRDVVYLDGNSLGALPVETAKRLQSAVLEEWGSGLIRSWTAHDWISSPQRVGDKIADLIGAQHGEVLVADSTSVNLYKLLHAALDARPGRMVVLSEPGNFPSDLYVAEGAIRARGSRHSLRLVPADRLAQSIDEDTALVLLTHVHYKTAVVHDMHEITSAAHARGALVLWDLSHSAGAIEVDLNAAEADFAVGCGYKYLNGGPGAPAFLFVARRHQQHVQSPLSGWLGHRRAFEFVDRYEPAAGIDRFQCGTPPILGMAALEAGVDLARCAGMRAVARKSQQLCELFISLVEQRCAGHGLRYIGARDAQRRGSHVAFAHPEGYSIMQALIARAVIGDFRAPDALRFGLTPLYTRYEDVWLAVEALREVLESGCWRQRHYSVRNAVT